MTKSAEMILKEWRKLLASIRPSHHHNLSLVGSGVCLLPVVPSMGENISGLNISKVPLPQLRTSRIHVHTNFCVFHQKAPHPQASGGKVYPTNHGNTTVRCPKILPMPFQWPPTVILQVSFALSAIELQLRTAQAGAITTSRKARSAGRRKLALMRTCN